MTLWKWSTDPATNGSADSTCPWPEGMAPSQVNDSARGNMAAIAKYRDDISGKLVTTGSSAAYAITSNQGFDTLAHLDGAMIAFVPHTTSDAAPTLNVDGLGAKPLRGQSGTALLPGVLLEGTPYVAFYNNTSGEFVLHSYFVNPGEIPIGGGIDYWGTTVPSTNFVFPYGQAISRTDNAVCFSRLGTLYGSGDGSTTFNVMDKRGRTSAGKDDMGGSAASRLTSPIAGGTIGATGGGQSNVVGQTNLPNISLSPNITQQPTYTTDAAKVLNTQSIFYGGSSGPINVPISVGASTVSLNNALAFTVPLGGSGTALSIVQPTIVCNYILRIK